MKDGDYFCVRGMKRTELTLTWNFSDVLRYIHIRIRWKNRIALFVCVCVCNRGLKTLQAGKYWWKERLLNVV